MELDFRSFAFVISLAAVINGLGIVSLLSGFAEYLKPRDDLTITGYWVYNLWAVFQFLLHILMWWTLWGVRTTEEFTFLHYLYLLCGPILLVLGSSLLLPHVEGGLVDLRKHYFRIRVPFFTVAALLWLWAIFEKQIFTGEYSPAVFLWVSYFIIMLVLRFVTNPKTHAALAVVSWMGIIFFIANYAMHLGGTNTQVG
jgi:hypothetical protein